MMSMQDLWEGRLKTSEYDVPAEDTATLSAAGENLLYDSAESCFQTHDMCVSGAWQSQAAETVKRWLYRT